MYEEICFMIRFALSIFLLLFTISAFWYVTWLFFLHRVKFLREMFGLPELKRITQVRPKRHN
jgi:hypothetical protein